MNPKLTETAAAELKEILLVEDDPLDVALTLAALEDEGLSNKVHVVTDGAEALDYLYRRGRYDGRAPTNPWVVLLDNKMPKVTGLEVLKIIKDDNELRMIPVVVLTSSRETPDLVEFYRHGVNAYVVKPLGFAEFVRAVSQLAIFWTSVNEAPYGARSDGLDALAKRGSPLDPAP